jgi:hypothetical protein
MNVICLLVVQICRMFAFLLTLVYKYVLTQNMLRVCISYVCVFYDWVYL